MNAMLLPNEFDLLLRQDLASFLHRSFLQLNPNVPLAWNWHLDLLADRLTEVYEGKLKRLIINVPPRSLKSILASVAFPAWVDHPNIPQRSNHPPKSAANPANVAAINGQYPQKHLVL